MNDIRKGMVCYTFLPMSKTRRRRVVILEINQDIPWVRVAVASSDGHPVLYSWWVKPEDLRPFREG